MELRTILSGIEGIKAKADLSLNIDMIECDSRKIKPNGMFVAIKGFDVDGSLYIKQAIDNGAVAISAKGKLSIHPADEAEPGNIAPEQTWPTRLDAVSVVSSGPILIVDGKDARLDEGSFNRNRHPRSAVGTAGKKVYLVAVDGRNADNAQGVSLWEFTKIMRWIGAEDVLNMDGGGSTTLYAEGENGSGIVNHPSDNKKFDREGERHIVNALLFVK